jgi:hypothetical protein
MVSIVFSVDVQEDFAVAIAAVFLKEFEAGLNVDIAHFGHDIFGVSVSSSIAAPYPKRGVKRITKLIPASALGS